MDTSNQTSLVPKDYWPCACVKRDANGTMTHIGMQPGTRRKCRECGARRPTGCMPLASDQQEAK